MVLPTSTLIYATYILHRYLLLSAVAGGACVRACVCMGVRESTRQPLVCISIFGYGRDGAQRPSSNPLRFPDAHQWFTVTGFALAVLPYVLHLFGAGVPYVSNPSIVS